MTFAGTEAFYVGAGFGHVLIEESMKNRYFSARRIDAEPPFVDVAATGCAIQKLARPIVTHMDSSLHALALIATEAAAIANRFPFFMKLP